jgi:hypothetical protein
VIKRQDKKDKIKSCTSSWCMRPTKDTQLHISPAGNNDAFLSRQQIDKEYY